MNRILLAFALCLVATCVEAVPVVTGADRSVSVTDGAGTTTYGASSPSSATGNFADTVTETVTPFVDVSSTQNSTIDAASGLFSGTGKAQVGFSLQNSDGYSAKSYYSTSFDLSSDYSYSLGANLETFLDGGTGLASFSLSGPTSLFYFVLDYDPPLNIVDSGILTAGSYNLIVSASIMSQDSNSPDGYYGGWVDYDFNLQLTPRDVDVPEPPIPALLLTGLMLLGIGCKKLIFQGYKFA